MSIPCEDSLQIYPKRTIGSIVCGETTPMEQPKMKQPTVNTAAVTVNTDAEEDQVLITQAAGGDNTAYHNLVQKYQRRAFSMAFNLLKSREDAEDVIQESFVKAYFSLHSFRGESSFYSWFYRIVRNMSIDFKRKVARRGGEHSEYDPSKSVSDSDLPLQAKVVQPDESFARKQELIAVAEVLNTLTVEHREMIRMREIDGLSYEEIADALGIAKGTVMSRLFYARKKLQDALREKETREVSSPIQRFGAVR